MKFLAAAIVAGALLVAPQARPADTAIVITNVAIVDASAANPLRLASIVVVGGRIAAIESSPRIPDGAQIIDARGKFVVPGLWDMHAHLAAVGAVGQAPERFVGHGVLHVRDMGGRASELLALRSAIEHGDRTGPTIVLAGPTLNGEQAADFHRKVTTGPEARLAVRELKTAGVDFIKVHRAIGREAFDAIANETKRDGLTFAGHVPLVMSWIEAANAGMRTIEHIQTIFENIQPNPALVPAQFDAIAERLNGSLGDAIFAALKRNGTFFDPTLIGYEATIETAAPAVAQRRTAAFVKMKGIAARAAKAGVRIIAGTDVLDRQGEMLWRELERLVEVGLTPQQALAAATVTSADAALRPAFGHVAVGAPASFLILDANPLTDIRNVRTLSAVVLRGRLLGADELARLRQ